MGVTEKCTPLIYPPSKPTLPDGPTILTYNLCQFVQFQGQAFSICFSQNLRQLVFSSPTKYKQKNNVKNTFFFLMQLMQNSSRDCFYRHLFNVKNYILLASIKLQPVPSPRSPLNPPPPDPLHCQKNIQILFTFQVKKSSTVYFLGLS